MLTEWLVKYYDLTLCQEKTYSQGDFSVRGVEKFRASIIQMIRNISKLCCVHK